jgi:carboxymethylenebutenolidase
VPDVTIAVPAHGTMPAYFSAARGSQGAAAPGVVVVHEAFGLNEDIREIADRFASLGYHAVAPDLLARGSDVRCLVGVVRALSSGRGRPIDEVDAARAWLADRDDCTGAIGIAGFCLGGGFALLLANRGFDASAVNYGRLPRSLDAALDGACPVVASYGGRDGSLRGTADSLRAALERAGVEHDVKEYPDAGHSFINHSSAPRWMAPFTGSLHAGHVDTAARDAWERIDAMFSSSLRPS